MSNNFESLRRQARTLESVLDAKLTSYSRLASSISRTTDLEASGAPERWNDLEAEIDGLLDKLEETNEEMSNSISSNKTDSPPPASSLHGLQHHRDALQDYKRDFSRTKANVKTALDQANLLTNVRSDINAYKTARSSAADSLLAERGRIDSSHRMIDATMQQAYAVREDFASQRSSLAGINQRMAGVLNTLPGINSLLGMIQSRRRRDGLNLGVLIALCVILLLSYVWR